MKERPILFNGDMIRAILDRQKTQTRRMVKPTTRDGKQPYLGPEWRFVSGRDTATGQSDYDRGRWCWQHTKDTSRILVEKSPFGAVGDRLWVRETFRSKQQCGETIDWVYRADCPALTEYLFPWTPSIHMPRRASRLTLEITAVRVEQVREISEEDAKAEGVTCPHLGEECCGYVPSRNTSVRPEECVCIDGYKPLFRTLWTSLYGPESWDRDWVWVYEFRRVK